LSENFIDIIPKELENCELLKTLDLSNNNIKEIPKELNNCKFLKYLYLSNNNIKEIPHFISQLLDLETLHLNNNRIEIIPEKITSVSKSINKAGYNFFKMTGMGETDMDLLSSMLPRKSNYFNKLKKLNLSGNQIKSIPEDILLLYDLILRLGSNNIKEIPLINREYNGIKELYLENNNINKISTKILNNINLKVLDISFNPIEEIHPKLLNSKLELII
jgi:Leucine-rich repeat (LRR) protein